MRKKLSKLLGLFTICALVIGATAPASSNAASKTKLSATKKTLYAGEQFALELTDAKGSVKWSS